MGRLKWSRTLVAAIALMMFAAVPALADVDNGGFESPDVTGWDVFDSSEIGEWTVEWQDAATACGGGAEPVLEIQDSGVVMTAYEGGQYAELDSDCQPLADSGNTNVKISQDVATMSGYNYVLSYAYAERTGSDSMLVTWPGDSTTQTGAANQTWYEASHLFNATSNTSTISFEEKGTPNTRGMFLDAVECVFCISDPTVTDLVYGRNNIDVGDITVTHDDMYIYIDIETDDPWVMHKTHVEMAADPSEFPQNGGGLIPGQFTYGNGPFVPGVTSDSIMIPKPAGPGTYYLAVHAELFELSDLGMYWATNVVSSTQGLRNDGTAVLAERSNPDDVLGAPDATANPYTGFYSLGFGGSIIVEFGAPIYNTAGDDLAGVEVTGGSYPEESAAVYFQYDGAWYLGGTLTNAGGSLQRTTFVEMPAWMPYADAVKLVDTTVSGIHNAAADGYDVDAIKAVQLVLSEETGWGSGETVGKNWSMYFEFEFNCPQPE